MDYNTQRDILHLPEYGRHVQQMIEQVKKIPDREKRNEQIRAVIQIMAILGPYVYYCGFRHRCGFSLSDA